MRTLTVRLCVAGTLLGLAGVAVSQDGGRYQYVFPRPHSQQLPGNTYIIVRQGEQLDGSSVVDRTVLSVAGAASGNHAGRTVLADDGKTLVFYPAGPFAPGEVVTVRMLDGARLGNGLPLAPLEFTFTVAEREPALFIDPFESDASARAVPPSVRSAQGRGASPDTLPADFPPVRIDSVKNPAPGELFLANFGAAPYANYLLVLNDSARALAYKRVGTLTNPFPYMFMKDPFGRLSYIERTPTTTVAKILDTAFNVIDTYPKGNPLTASHADFFRLPNGHALALFFDYQIVDMSKIVKGGNPSANVMGSSIVEYDAAKNVIFQWRSFDYIAITDTYEDTLAATIDYTHGNGIDLDFDGNILLSSRHTSEITKIDRNTGEMIWRLGGKRNQFTFINEHPENAPVYFSYQHDIKRLPNGHVTLFDNGNKRPTQYSRAVEYALDEQNKTATLVWEYRHIPDVYASAQGSVQRLDNGNTLIGWGDASLTGKVAATEVHPDNSIAMELYLPTGHRTMRIYRLPWLASSRVASRTLHDLLPGNTYIFNGIPANQQTGVSIKFYQLSPVFYNSAVVEKYSTAALDPVFTDRTPWTIPTRFTIAQVGMTSFDTDISFDLTRLVGLPDPATVQVFRRDTVGRGTFTRLPTTYNSVTNVLGARSTAFGEFLLGWTDTDTAASPPILYVPLNGDSVNQQASVLFKWTPRGYADGFQLHLSTDSLFGTLVRNDSLLTQASDTVKTVTPRLRYFWRVRSRNGARTGNWSPVWNFIATPPYISLTSPDEKAVWNRGKPSFIVWHCNITAKVRIDLFRNGAFAGLIADSVNNIGSFSWTISPSQPVDSTYAVRVRSVSDSTLFGFSTGKFSIRSAPNAVDAREDVPAALSLYQNYPNPFNPATVVSYQLPVLSYVTLAVYDLLGREVAVLADGKREAGVHRVKFDASALPSGVYIYRIQGRPIVGGQAGTYVESKKLLLVR